MIIDYDYKYLFKFMLCNVFPLRLLSKTILSHIYYFIYLCNNFAGDKTIKSCVAGNLGL